MDRKLFSVVPVPLLPTLVSNVLAINIHYLSDSQQVPYLPVVTSGYATLATPKKRREDPKKRKRKRKKKNTSLHSPRPILSHPSPPLLVALAGPPHPSPAAPPYWDFFFLVKTS